MIIYSTTKKKAFAIERIILKNGIVTANVDYDVDNVEDIFFGAQELRYVPLIEKNECIKIFWDGYSFSIDELKELQKIKSEIEFKEKYFPDYEINDSEKARMMYFNLEGWAANIEEYQKYNDEKRAK